MTKYFNDGGTVSLNSVRKLLLYKLVNKDLKINLLI